MTTEYKLPEPDYSRLSDLQSGIDDWYSPNTLRTEIAAAEKRGAEAMKEKCVSAAERGTNLYHLLQEIRSIEL